MNLCMNQIVEEPWREQRIICENFSAKLSGKAIILKKNRDKDLKDYLILDSDLLTKENKRLLNLYTKVNMILYLN